MRRLNLVSLFILWSSSIFASVNKAPPPYVRVEGVVKNEFQVSNMPRERCIGEFPICFGAAPTVVAQRHYCKVNQISDCKNLPPDKEISTFSVVSWARKNTVICHQKDGVTVDESGVEVPSEYCGQQELSNRIQSSYSNIGIFGGNAIFALTNASTTFSFKSEACYPSEKIINKYGKTKETVDEFMARVKSFFESNKSKTNCDDCLEKLVADANDLLNVNTVDVVALKNALNKNTVQEFLYKLVFRDCASLTAMKKPKTLAYPDLISRPGVKNPTSVDDIATMLEEVMKTDTPVILSKVCTERDKNDECVTRHAIVVSGVRLVCPTNSSDESKCRKMYKIQNSNCGDWAKNYDGGWVDQKSLMANVKVDPIDMGTLSWYE